jgi:hypothetical protein
MLKQLLQNQSRPRGLLNKLPSTPTFDDESPGLSISPAGFKPRRTLMNGPAVAADGLGASVADAAGDKADDVSTPSAKLGETKVTKPPVVQFSTTLVPPVHAVGCGSPPVLALTDTVRPSTEAIEEAAFKALSGRTGARAKAKAKAKAAVKAGAKAKAKPPAIVMKRPAAAVVDEVLADAWSPSDGDKEKRFFQSKIYHRVKKLCKHRDIDDDEQIKGAASTAFKQAGDIWMAKSGD